MTRWVPAVASLLALLAGCSILNKPDRDRIHADGGTDGGRDGGTDAPPGLDAADAPDLGPGDAGPPPEVCGNGRDDDRDGLVDCDDFDCGGEAACCDVEAGMLPIDETTFESGRWASSSARDEPFLDSGDISDFGPGGSGLVHDECVPLGQGGRISASFVSLGRPCDGDPELCEFAALTLSPVNTGGPDLPAELRVMVRGGQVIVTQEGLETPETLELAAGARDVATVVELRPGVADGRAVLFPTVRVMGVEAMAEGAPIEQRNFSPCGTLNGLYVAFEGRGDDVGVRGVVEGRAAECASPSQFDRVLELPLAADTYPERTSLDWTPEEGLGDPWASAWIGAPSMLIVNDRLHVAGHASNHDPNIEPGGWVGTAIGHSEHTSPTWGTVPLLNGGVVPLDEPRLGDQPPSCFGEGCPVVEFKYREPNLFALGENVLMVAARAELRSDVYSIVMQRTRGGADVVVLEPGVDGDPLCVSLRDPFVAPAQQSVYPILFYTCVEGSGATSVRARVLNPTLDETEGEIFDILGKGQNLGPFSNDVFSPEVVVDLDDHGTPEVTDDELVYRIWFMGYLPGTELAVGLAVGRVAAELGDGGGNGRAPATFSPYPANPVLRDDDPSLSTGCDQCRALAQGFTVARVPLGDDNNRLRFLLARDLRTSDSSHARFEFLPLEQVWVPDSL